MSHLKPYLIMHNCSMVLIQIGRADIPTVTTVKEVNVGVLKEL